MSTEITYDPSIDGKGGLAKTIARYFKNWQDRRASWLSSYKELQEYIYSTDTSQTSNRSLPWKNRTVYPKICQIRDNLHANYMTSLFPNEDWLDWEALDNSDITREKAKIIKAYMKRQLRASGFKQKVSKLVYDFIDGNAFAMPEVISERFTNEETGEIIQGYTGAQLKRLSPLDISFNPTAENFEDAPKIIRTIVTKGELMKAAEDKPEQGYLLDAIQFVSDRKTTYSESDISFLKKDTSFTIPGIGSIQDYIDSPYIEILDFYGDIYDEETGKVLKNYIVSIADRAHVIRKIPNPSWLGRKVIHHAGWRERPDSLYAMGALDNLVGLQYRINHIENLKADAVDLAIFPIIKQYGEVEDFDVAPGTKVHLADRDSDVVFLSNNFSSFDIDSQISLIEQRMEDMAGAPRQAAGIRSPGEKTAYEVQVLENSIGRIFQNKIQLFEELLIEPLLNSLLEAERRNFVGSQILPIKDTDSGITIFKTITKEDITANGVLKPVGSRHFAEKARKLQNMIQFLNSPLFLNDPLVRQHVSPKNLVKYFEELLELPPNTLYRENIRIGEEAETQQLIQQVSEQMGQTNPSAEEPQETM